MSVAVIAVAAALVAAFAAGAWWRAERRLRSSREDLESAEHSVQRFLESLPGAVIGTDMTGAIVSANARAAELARRNVHDLMGRPLLDLVAVRDRDDVAASWTGVTTPSEPTVFELVDRDGAGHFVEATFHSMGSAQIGDGTDGEEVSSVVLLRDVSERERTAEALDQARRWFQRAFHSAPTGMALVRMSDDRIVDVNQSLADLLDHSRRYLLGRSMRELTHIDDLRAVAAERSRIEFGIDDSYRT